MDKLRMLLQYYEAERIRKHSERVWDVTTYEFVSNSPMDIMKEIVEKANSRLFD